MLVRQETFKLLYASTDGELSDVTRLNESAYTDYDVIAATHLFTSANDAPINDVTLGFPLTHAGATFAFREQVNHNHLITHYISPETAFLLCECRPM